MDLLYGSKRKKKSPQAKKKNDAVRFVDLGRTSKAARPRQHRIQTDL